MKYWFYDVVKGLLWLFFRLGFGLEVLGQDRVPTTGAFLLASNHVSYLDPPLIGVACPRRLSFMAQADLFKHLLLGAFLRGVHAIPLRRGEGDLGAMREALARLRRGEAVAIFPEGARQVSGRLGAAKRGAGLLAATARVPFVPVQVKGTYEALPPRARRVRRAKIRVAFGEAISYTKAAVSSLHASKTERGEGPPSPRDDYQRLADALSSQWRRLEEQWP